MFKLRVFVKQLKKAKRYKGEFMEHQDKSYFDVEEWIQNYYPISYVEIAEKPRNVTEDSFIAFIKTGISDIVQFSTIVILNEVKDLQGLTKRFFDKASE